MAQLGESAQPFETVERQERRARQRRELWLIEDWYVEEVASAHAIVSLGVEPHDRPLLEEWFRNQADAERERLPAELVDRSSFSLAERRLAALEALDEDAILEQLPILTGGGRPSPFKEIRNELDAQLEDDTQVPLIQSESSGSPPAVISQEEADMLARYVLFLVLADDLSGDGYTDPRVEKVKDEAR